MKKKVLLFLVLFLIISSTAYADDDCSDEASGDTPCTFDRNEAEPDELSSDDVEIIKSLDNGTVHIYFFHKDGCSHCKDAKTFFSEKLDNNTDVTIHSFRFEDRRKYYIGLFEKFEQEYDAEIAGFPVIIIGDRLFTGFHLTHTPKQILKQIKDVQNGMSYVNEKKSRKLDIPIIGEVNVATLSLLPFTINIGLIDGLNPCAIWVLMVLLSLMIRAKSRKRIAFIGFIFVFTSGFVYFLFMSAWLNIFSFIGISKPVTIVLGVLAVVIGLINIKELFFFKSGVSLMIPEKVKPRLYEKARHLFKEKNLLFLVLGTISFAFFVNLIELGCTIGLPAVYTRILSLRETPQLAKYAYMALYCTAYIVPLLVVVAIFFLTLGRHSLTEKTGKVLKIINGTLMLVLGIALLSVPNLLLG